MQKTLNWNIIYKENSPKLLGICRRYVSDLATAEDIVQDSFLKAIENQHQLKIENALFSWLKTIVINNALQFLKRSKDVSTNDMSLDFEKIEDEVDESNFLSQQFSTEEMLASIDLLPSHYKAVFNLYFLENYSHAEIAEQLGININTSKSHLLRAKKTAKQQLMNNNQNSNALKKRGIQLLLFVGFGNLLWAKSFQKNFAEFTIQPQNEFLPEISTKNFKEFNGRSKTISKRSTSKWAIALLLIFSIVFFIYNSKIISSNNIQGSKINSIEEQGSRSLEKPSLNNINSIENSTENNPTKIENSNKTILQNKNFNDSKPLEVTEKPAKNTKNNVRSITKVEAQENVPKILVSENDSTKNVQSNKVIIVKKIIKRDTVFIKK